ncbi:hypothetical protein ACMA5I_11730 [Paracoccaceae bacterium GXU_MW_L88]
MLGLLFAAIRFEFLNWKEWMLVFGVTWICGVLLMISAVVHTINWQSRSRDGFNKEKSEKNG